VAVALVGLPGAGKSAVGRRLGLRLDLPFVDTDHEIEQRIDDYSANPHSEPVRLMAAE